jgi:hypothetical protein
VPNAFYYARQQAALKAAGKPHKQPRPTLTPEERRRRRAEGNRARHAEAKALREADDAADAASLTPRERRDEHIGLGPDDHDQVLANIAAIREGKELEVREWTVTVGKNHLWREIR